MNSQNNFNLEATGRSWYNGVGQELEATWGQLPQFKSDILHMKFCFAQRIWLDSDMYAVESRRQCVYAFGASIFDSPNIKPRFHDWWNFYGVDSVSGKLVSTVCTLYNKAPYREFSTDKGQQEALTDLYEEYNANLAFKTAYRYAYLVNCVVLLPDFEKKEILVLTPDMFRFQGPELWYAKYENDDKGVRVLRFHSWDAKEHKVVDNKGNLVRREDNPYGRIPATVLKLNQTEELYGAGVSEAAEINVWQNTINYFTTKIGVFQSHSIMVANGIEKSELDKQYLGVGAVITIPGVTGDKAPSLEYITPQNFIDILEAQKQKRVRQFERDQHLPGFLVDEGAGQPPTGAALQVLERPLNDKREEHTPSLVKGEKDFADLLATGTNLHDKTRSLVVGKFSIQYADVETFNDPKAEFEHDKELKAEGLISPSAYVQKYTNQRMSDADAVKFMNDNKAAFKGPTATPPPLAEAA